MLNVSRIASSTSSLRPPASLGAIYRMEPSTLAEEFRRTADAGTGSSSKQWDALMYRASVLGPSSFGFRDIALIMDAFLKYDKYYSEMFAEHLLMDKISSGRSESALSGAALSVSDLTMIMHAVDRLGMLPKKNIWKSYLSPLIQQQGIKQTMKFEDVAKLTITAAKHGDDRLFEKCCSILLNMKNLPNEPKWITRLLDGFVRASSSHGSGSVDTTAHDAEEPFFEPNVSLSNQINYELFSKLLNHAIKISPSFNAADVVFFGRSVARISADILHSKLGHPNAIPLRNLVHRSAKRTILSMKPNHLVELLEVFETIGIPDRSLILKELTYRVAHLRPATCVHVLSRLKADELADDRLIGAFFSRLTKYDANTTLSVGEIIDLGKVGSNIIEKNVVGEPSASLISQVLLGLLPNFSRKRSDFDLVPFFDICAALIPDSTADVFKRMQEIFHRNKPGLMRRLSLCTDGATVTRTLLNTTRLNIFDDDLLLLAITLCDKESDEEKRKSFSETILKAVSLQAGEPDRKLPDTVIEWVNSRVGD